MKIELILHNVIQNRSNLIAHNIKAISPRLDVACGMTCIRVTGWALQPEIDEIMEFIGHHHSGDHTLRIER